MGISLSLGLCSSHFGVDDSFITNIERFNMFLENRNALNYE